MCNCFWTKIQWNEVKSSGGSDFQILASSIENQGNVLSIVNPGNVHHLRVPTSPLVWDPLSHLYGTH